MDIIPTGKKIPRKYDIEVELKEFKQMVSAYTLLNYLEWEILFIVHTEPYDKQLGTVISKNKKLIELLLRKLRKPQCYYTMSDKEIILIVKQFQGILFGYEINVYPYHKNFFYATNMSEYQIVM